MKNKAFSLIELLIVLAFIALLIGVLVPALSKARQSALAEKAKEIQNKPFIEILESQEGISNEVFCFKKIKDVQTGRVYILVITIRGSSVVEIVDKER